MVKKKTPSPRHFSRNPRKVETITTFVVYVRFPSGAKEYAYLCNTPNLRQGDKVIANNTVVEVLRTAAHDPFASKWVKPIPSAEETARHNRTVELVTRLNKLFAEFEAMNRFAIMAKTNPEAKKLLSELKFLRQSAG